MDLNGKTFAELKAIKMAVDAAFESARGAQLAEFSAKQAALKAAEAELAELSGNIGMTNRGRPKGSKNKPKVEAVTEAPAAAE